MLHVKYFITASLGWDFRFMDAQGLSMSEFKVAVSEIETLGHSTRGPYHGADELQKCSTHIIVVN